MGHLRVENNPFFSSKVVNNFLKERYSPRLSALHARSSLKLLDRQFLNGRPPLYFVKRGKLIDIVFLTPPLCFAERGTGGEFIRKRKMKLYCGSFFHLFLIF